VQVAVETEHHLIVRQIVERLQTPLQLVRREHHRLDLGAKALPRHETIDGFERIVPRRQGFQALIGIEKSQLPAKGDHPLATVGVVAQTACDVAANLNLHSRLAEVDIAVVAQLKAHHVLHDPVKPLRIADKKVRRSEAIREVWDDGQGERACCWSAVPPRARAVSR
jgi:hypothetical protein